MGNCLVRLERDGRSWILNWSSIVDAPTEIFEDEDDLRAWTKDEFGNQGVAGLDQRLERLQSKGTSSHHDASAADVIACNRAGKDETELTMDQIIDYYCLTDCTGDPPMGKPHGGDEDDATQD